MTPAARAAALRLRLDHATREVLTELRAAGIRTVLLKGQSTADWLYPGVRRDQVDCDLLVAPADLASAADALSRLGFSPSVEEQRMPAWWREHAVGWLRRRDGAIIDLHRTLPGVGVDDECLWAVLSGATDVVLVAGCPTPALAIPARALHLALHAAQDGDAGARSARDLQRAVERSSEVTWRAAADLAEALDATGALAAGLSLTRDGAELAERLGLPASRRIDVAVRSSRGPVTALTIDRLARARGLRERIAIVRFKLAPPSTFMRAWSRLARRGPSGLAVAYAVRPVWVVARAPLALLGWLWARHKSRRSRR